MPQPRFSRRWRIFAAAALLLLFLGAMVCYQRPIWVVDQALRLRLRIAGVDSRYVQVGAYRVHYFVGGEGKPLLLIHGLASRAEDWAPEMPGYAKNGFRVYAIDLLGCGRSAKPDIAYSIQQQVDLVNGFLDAVHVPTADVAGWSMGGWIGLEFTLQHSERVSRVVAMDAAGLHYTRDFDTSVFEPKNVQQLDRLYGLIADHPPRLPTFVKRDLVRRLSRSAWIIHRMVESMLTGQNALDGRLNQIHVPVLIVWGAQDRLTPTYLAERMHAAMPQSVLEVYQGCGHAAPARCAGRIVPDVVRFLHNSPPMAAATETY